MLAEEAQKIASHHDLTCEVWDEDRIREERMEAIAAVGMGSDNPPRFIRLEHNPPGTQEEAPLVLIGKGVTFDTGGLSIKTAVNMDSMKDDMAGAAVVLSVMSALAQSGYPHRVIGLVAAVENMISGHSQRPGDIVRARNGKTIEVLNTDAEGRLILADALSYASELRPRAIVDLATLTGGVGVALGQEGAGIFCNDDRLAQSLCDAGVSAGERLWRFPLWEEYRDYVRGGTADLKNIGPERRALAIVGAVFLENFVDDGIPWAHLDIAAVSLIRHDRPLCAPGATGFGARLLLEWLRNEHF